VCIFYLSSMDLHCNFLFTFSVYVYQKRTTSFIANVYRSVLLMYTKQMLLVLILDKCSFVVS